MTNATTLPTSKRIVIQGYQGAFHEIAARLFFKGQELDIIPADTFEELISVGEDAQKSEGAIMAIENSIAGSILYNYQLVHNSDLRIIGEIYLRIRQNLMTLPGQKIEDLKEVHSHYMAIAQCRDFFRNYPDIRLVESADTALSAKYIRDNKLKNVGAIASTLAAEVYDLDIIGDSIETNKQNYTRFLILDRDETSGISKQLKETTEKVSISFTLRHQVGSLHRVLAALAEHGANLTKIQSVPIVGKKWQYLFFVDFVLDQPAQYDKAIVALLGEAKNVRVLGTYKKGTHHEY